MKKIKDIVLGAIVFASLFCIFSEPTEGSWMDNMLVIIATKAVSFMAFVLIGDLHFHIFKS